MTADRLLREIEAEFDTILSGPGVRWNKEGIKSALKTAIINVLTRHVKVVE